MTDTAVKSKTEEPTKRKVVSWSTTWRATQRRRRSSLWIGTQLCGSDVKSFYILSGRSPTDKRWYRNNTCIGRCMCAHVVQMPIHRTIGTTRLVLDSQRIGSSCHKMDWGVRKMLARLTSHLHCTFGLSTVLSRWKQSQRVQAWFVPTRRICWICDRFKSNIRWNALWIGDHTFVPNAWHARNRRQCHTTAEAEVHQTPVWEWKGHFR